MAETIFVGHKPNTHKVYNAVGGWSIMFLDDKGNSRPANGGKIYKYRQNAYRDCKSLNHPIQHAIKRYGMCEAYHDGYTLVVRENDPGYSKTDYCLTIQLGQMPPHFTQDFKTIDEVEEHLREQVAFPVTLSWLPVKPEA